MFDIFASKVNSRTLQDELQAHQDALEQDCRLCGFEQWRECDCHRDSSEPYEA